MKRALIIVFAVFIFNVAKSFAQPMPESMLRVHLTDNTQISTIEIDGRPMNKRGTGITVGDLPPGKHRLKIYQVVQGRWGRGYEQVVYNGKVKTTDGMISLFDFDPATGATATVQQPIDAYMSSHPEVSSQIQARRNNQGGYNGGGGYGYPPYGNGYGGNGNPGYNGGGYSDNGQYSNAPVRDAAPTLTDAKISDLKTQTAAKGTDIERQKLLQSALAGEQMSTQQIGAIMDWFDFESSKESFAEWAYANTVDKENFVSLENRFSYKEYQDALDKFIKSK